MHSGRTSEAIPNLRHCAEQIPEFMPARAGLVSALLLNGEEAEAEAQARDIIRISPNYDIRKFINQFPDISAAFERIAAKIDIA